MDPPTFVIPDVVFPEVSADGTFHLPVADAQLLAVALGQVRSYIETQTAKCAVK